MVTGSTQSGRGYITTLGKLFTPYAPVTKKYNVVPVNGRRRSAAGKETVGPALHWHCVTYISH